MMYLMIAGVCGIAIWFAFRMAEQKGREKERLEILEDETEKLKEYRAKAHKIKEDEKRDLENVSTLDGARDFWVQRNRKK
tara:strand:+ start:299 stop:538 length:240 start_codon:yes stop_codon:yes gene_type:complete